MSESMPESMPEPTPAPAATAEPTAHEVLSYLCHELRERLSTLDSVAHYLRLVTSQRGQPETGVVQVQIEKIQSLTRQMDWVLTDALHLVRGVPGRSECIDLHELLSSAVSENELPSSPRFVLHFDEKDALVEMNPWQARHLAQGLVRLFQHSSAKEAVEVRTEVSDDEVTVEFQADRSKWPQERLDEMMVPFHVSSAPESGLALATARRIIEASGGRIGVKAETGLTVRGSIPLASGE